MLSINQADKRKKSFRVDPEMADVSLTLQEAGSRELPLVCMRCGEAGRLISKNHLYYWVHRVDLRSPLCHLHKDHLKWRTWWLAAAFPLSVLVALFGMIPVGLIAAAQVPPIRVSFSCVIVLFIISIIACLSFSRIGIRVTKLGHDNVTLTGVATEFAEAVRVWRQDKCGTPITSLTAQQPQSLSPPI